MKTLIWDFNGTIIDDAVYCLEIEKKMLRDRGMYADFTLEEYKDMFCFPVIDYYYKLGYTFENESYDDISVEFNRLYAEGFSSVKLVEGFRETIVKATELGYQHVILSATREDLLKKQCRDLGIDGLFKEILGTDNLLAGSKIDMAKRWMKENDIVPEECLYIGDTIHDLETAAALNIKNYTLVSCGHQSYKVLKEYTDRVVHSLSEVPL